MRATPSAALLTEGLICEAVLIVAGRDVAVVVAHLTLRKAELPVCFLLLLTQLLLALLLGHLPLELLLLELQLLLLISLLLQLLLALTLALVPQHALDLQFTRPVLRRLLAHLLLRLLPGLRADLRCGKQQDSAGAQDHQNGRNRRLSSDISHFAPPL